MDIDLAHDGAFTAEIRADMMCPWYRPWMFEIVGRLPDGTPVSYAANGGSGHALTLRRAIVKSWQAFADHEEEWRSEMG